MKKQILRIAAVFVAVAHLGILTARADEGMWLPLLIKRLNYEDMKKMGLKLSAEEIYSINNSSLKDAVVQLGGFCTAEVISSQGLLLTNHHCAYDAIQSHSSVKNDYLTNGFWAYSKGEELPNPGLTVSFVQRIEDVTAQVNAKLKPGISEAERRNALRGILKEVSDNATKGTHFNAVTRSFFDGNEFYLFVYETFRDVRLVGAPPSSIGKFGGDTDNWMWPRHTGDFSLLRVYAGPDGKPADYSPNNVPIKPKHFLPVSLKGTNLNDFSMTIGFPGRTNRYLTSYGVKMALEKDQPARVKIRGKKLELMKEDMDADAKVRIKYASKYAQISNYWKYFIGQQAGLKRLRVYDKKKQTEEEFSRWAAADPARKQQYGNVVSSFDTAYQKLSNYILAEVYTNEALFGSEAIVFSLNMIPLQQALKSKPVNMDNVKAAAEEVREGLRAEYKDYNAATDQKITAAMLEMFYKDVPKEQHPDIYNLIQSKYKGDFNRFAADMIGKSIVTDSTRLMKFLDNPDLKTLENDLAFKTAMSVLTNIQTKISPATASVNEQLEQSKRLYFAGLREMTPDKKYAPNANSTMRLSYGKVLDYYPQDAVHYRHFTTLEGVIAKEDSTNEEFIVPQKLKDLYNKKDYGRYADKDGKLHVCFISNNDITGGNSGSPVIDGEGNLIGLAFDGNWEAMSGDIAFETDYQRTISVDARYVMFIIDKFAGAKNIIDEIKFVD